MDRSLEEFQGIVTHILARFYKQLARPLPATQIPRFAAQLAALVLERGLPRPLRHDETGEPGGMSENECAPLVARVMEGVDDSTLADAARQLVKACFYPEFKICRDSFREVARDGSCRRQEVERARHRLSGAHCVDCPHWVALVPDDHAAYLMREWRSQPEDFVTHRTIFLPEDFRALRCWLYEAARISK
jgi:hypothetical protein